MKVFIIDISGKVTSYDIALSQAISECDKSVKVKLITADVERGAGRINLISLIPSRFKQIEHPLKRMVKAIEGILNYIYIISLVMIKKPDVVHFQWFPFMDFCSVDNIFIKLFKTFRSKQCIFFTVHNVYPHNMSSRNRVKYKKRFMEMSKYIDYYISHTITSKEELVKEYALEQNRICVIPHGIFTPDYMMHEHNRDCYVNIIMYGNNLPYKGSDLLLDSVQLLPVKFKNRIKLTIVGATSSDYLELLRTKTEGLNVNIIPSFVSDEQLYELINDADYIALPYRKITQSGVLLLALYFKKPLLVSNLPSFVETLRGFSEDMFFKSDDPESLKELIIRHIEGTVDVKKQLSIIDELNELYSWNNSAKMTIDAYKKAI